MDGEGYILKILWKFWQAYIRKVKKIDVVEFLLENLNSENQFTQTQDYVVKKLNISKQTVNDAFKYLVEQNFMKKIGSVYVVNPNYVCAFGSDKKNATIAVRYSYDEEKSLFDTLDSPPGAGASLRASNGWFWSGFYGRRAPKKALNLR